MSCRETDSAGWLVHVSFTIETGEAFDLVGESGSGKTTLGRLLLRREDASDSSICFDGPDITQLGGAALRRIRPWMQMVFHARIARWSAVKANRQLALVDAAPAEVYGRFEGRPSDE